MLLPLLMNLRMLEPPPVVETVTMPYWDVAVMQRQKGHKKQDLETLLLLLG